MKKKLICVVILLSIVFTATTAISLSRNIAFFREADILSSEDFDALLPSEEYLVFTDQQETEDFFIRLMAFRDEEKRSVNGTTLDGIRFLWHIEPRGNTQLHRYEFRVMPSLNLGWHKKM